jgi:hypothetical protein
MQIENEVNYYQMQYFFPHLNLSENSIYIFYLFNSKQIVLFNLKFSLIAFLSWSGWASCFVKIVDRPFNRGFKLYI